MLQVIIYENYNSSGNKRVFSFLSSLVYMVIVRSLTDERYLQTNLRMAVYDNKPDAFTFY